MARDGENCQDDAKGEGLTEGEDPNSEDPNTEDPNRRSSSGCRNDNGQGISCDWETIRQHRARIRALCKAISNSLPEKRIPSAKMLNRRVKKLTELIEILDDLERDCPKVDWSRANDLIEIYCTGERLPERE